MEEDGSSSVMHSVITGHAIPVEQKGKGFARVPTPKISVNRPSTLVMDDGTKKNLPNPYKLRRFYLPSEVSVHNSNDSCWVSIFNRVFDLTKLIQENSESPLCDPIVLSAGTDITHWFSEETRDPKTFIDKETATESAYCPIGRYLHIPPNNSQSDVATECAPFDTPWWQDNEKYQIGRLTKKVRKVTIMNMLTKDDETIDVASEENMNEILDRYLDYNAHAASYTWKRLGKVLDMDSTLQENHIPDETAECL